MADGAATPMTGLVLAGGASRRMGRDKALLRVDGTRLVDRAVRVLSEVCDTVLLAAGDRRIDVDGATPVADAEGGGPLAGIVAGLELATTPLVAVVAVDMPNADGGVLEQLAALWDGEAGVAPMVGGVVQPLHAVYATAFTAEFRDLLAGGERSPRCALETLGARVVDTAGWSTTVFADNLNSPEDLRRRQAAPTEAR